MSIKLTKAAAKVAKLIRIFNFFRGRGLDDSINHAYLTGYIEALSCSGISNKDEKSYLLKLLNEGELYMQVQIDFWGGCIASPAYFPYQTHLEELAAAEMEGVAVSSRAALPAGAFTCSPEGISFHKVETYQGRFRAVEMKKPLGQHDDPQMKLVTLDSSIDSEWYAADIAIAITVMLATYRAGPTVLGFESINGDLLPNCVLEGARRAKKFDKDFPATWDEIEHDYRLMHPGEPFLLDYYWLVIRNEGVDVVVREPLLDPNDCPY